MPTCIDSAWMEQHLLIETDKGRWGYWKRTLRRIKVSKQYFYTRGHVYLRCKAPYYICIQVAIFSWVRHTAGDLASAWLESSCHLLLKHQRSHGPIRKTMYSSHGSLHHDNIFAYSNGLWKLLTCTTPIIAVSIKFYNTSKLLVTMNINIYLLWDTNSHRLKQWHTIHGICYQREGWNLATESICHTLAR